MRKSEIVIRLRGLNDTDSEEEEGFVMRPLNIDIVQIRWELECWSNRKSNTKPSAKN